MKILANTISIIAGLIIVFGIYSGKILWIIAGAVPLILLALLSFYKRRSLLNKANAEINSEIEALKKNGEKIIVDLDKCEIKDSSYSHDVIDERMTRLNQINLDYGKVIGQEFVGQSLLTYHYSNGNSIERFVQAFPCEADTLKVHVIQNLVTLYVDRLDRSRYFFELKAD